jgi:hypothetical protein
VRTTEDRVCDYLLTIEDTAMRAVMGHRLLGRGWVDILEQHIARCS